MHSDDEAFTFSYKWLYSSPHFEKTGNPVEAINKLELIIYRAPRLKESLHWNNEWNCRFCASCLMINMVFQPCMFWLLQVNKDDVLLALPLAKLNSPMDQLNAIKSEFQTFQSRGTHLYSRTDIGQRGQTTSCSTASLRYWPGGDIQATIRIASDQIILETWTLS